MLPRYRALFLRKYKKLLSQIYELNRSNLHRGVTKAISDLVNYQSIDVADATPRVLKLQKFS